LRKISWSPVPFKWLWLSAVLISAIFIMNAWVSYNLGSMENPFGWFFESVTVISSYCLWALIIPLLYRFVVCKEPLWKLTLGTILFHLLLSIIVAAIHRYAALGLFVVINWGVQGYILDLFGGHSLAWVIKGTIPSFIQYWLILGLLWGLRYYRLKRAQEIVLIKKDQEIANAQFNALKMQLHPHFFFNTLNTISSVMDRDIEDAQTIVAKLAKLMRSLVDSDKRQFTSLEKELEYIRDYLHIEQARFGDSLKVNFEIEAQANCAEIPNLLLQPLVENSIKHGFGQKRGDKQIIVSAKVNQHNLLLSVQDNGVGAANVDYVLQNTGVGLKSVMDRLDHLYAESANLKAKSTLNQGFLIEIVMPFKRWER